MKHICETCRTMKTSSEDLLLVLSTLCDKRMMKMTKFKSSICSKSSVKNASMNRKEGNEQMYENVMFTVLTEYKRFEDS